MTSGSWVALVVAALLAFWMLGAHNRVVALRNAIVVAWSQCEPRLLQRAQAVLLLVEQLRPLLLTEVGTLDAARHAQALLAAACDAARPRPTLADAVLHVARCDAALAPTLTRLTALAELLQPPDAEVASTLQQLRELEDGLRFARQRYNDAVEIYNQATRQWPTRLLAPLFRFDAAGLL